MTGHIGQFLGKLGTVKVQLHDGLELMVGGIRVVAAADNKHQFMLGKDLFAPAGTKLREVLVPTEKGIRSVILEVGP